MTGRMDWELRNKLERDFRNSVSEYQRSVGDALGGGGDHIRVIRDLGVGPSAGRMRAAKTRAIVERMVLRINPRWLLYLGTRVTVFDPVMSGRFLCVMRGRTKRKVFLTPLVNPDGAAARTDCRQVLLAPHQNTAGARMHKGVQTANRRETGYVKREIWATATDVVEHFMEGADSIVCGSPREFNGLRNWLLEGIGVSSFLPWRSEWGVRPEP